MGDFAAGVMRVGIRPRWQVVTQMHHLKQTMELDVLHCQRLAGVMKELTVCALVDNLVRSALSMPCGG